MFHNLLADPLSSISFSFEYGEGHTKIVFFGSRSSNNVFQCVSS